MAFSRLEKDGILDARWYNLYGPYRSNGLMRRLKYAYKYGTDEEEYLYFGRVLASAKFGPTDNASYGLKNTETAPVERKKEYNFWLDIYELKIYDSEHYNSEICVEFQINTKIKLSEKAYFLEKSKKYIWKPDSARRFKRIAIELPEDKYQLPFGFIRIKKIGTSIFSSDTYIGYIKIDLNNYLNLGDTKPTWISVRKTETAIDNIEDNKNVLGDILCNFNCFLSDMSNNQEIKRPVLLETRIVKKFKLVGIIYMGKHFPLKEEALFLEIIFYNDPKKDPIVTDDIIKESNPEWNDVLFITAMLNEGLELSENIKLIAKFRNGLFGNNSEEIGRTEIPVSEIDNYNHQDFIEQDVYKKSKWYNLINPITFDVYQVLARFMLVKLIKNESEDLEALDNRNLVPENVKYIFMIFIIGVRNVSDNLEEGAVQVSYKGEPFEEIRTEKLNSIKPGKELFKYKNETYADNNYNNLDVKKLNIFIFFLFRFI
jgi:hypothetical protein